MADGQTLNFDDLYGGSAAPTPDGKITGIPVCRSAHSLLDAVRDAPGGTMVLTDLATEKTR